MGDRWSDVEIRAGSSEKFEARSQKWVQASREDAKNAKNFWLLAPHF
jgi:hypothetical protein